MYIKCPFQQKCSGFPFQCYNSSIPDLKGGTGKGSMMPETDRQTLKGENAIFYATVVNGVIPPFTSPCLIKE